MRMKLKEDMLITSEQKKYHKHCKYCGRTISFYAFEKDKKLCSWCGRYNYRSGLVEFKDKLKKEERGRL